MIQKYCSKQCYYESETGIPGKKHSEETKKKMSESAKGRISWNKGKKFPEWSGQNNHNWKGGISSCSDCGKVLSSRRPKRCKVCYLLVLNAQKGEKHPNWKGGISPRENTKRYLANNPEKMSYYNRKRRLAKLNAVGSHTIEVSRGGSDYIDNIQPLCQTCNQRKNIKTISYLPISNSNFSIA